MHCSQGYHSLFFKINFQSYETCFEIWEHAKVLYTNDTQRVYGVYPNLSNVGAPRHQDSMVDYIGKIHAICHEFNELLHHASTHA